MNAPNEWCPYARCHGYTAPEQMCETCTDVFDAVQKAASGREDSLTEVLTSSGRNVWASLSAQIFIETGHSFTPLQLASSDFCFKQLARMGYSLSVVYVTRSSIGDGAYQYQIQGGPVEKRGDHGVPLVPTLAQAAATALYNVCRLYENHRKTKKEA